MKAAIFGASDANPRSWEWQEAYGLGKELAKIGHEVWTDGGGGIAEAACQGAKDAKGKTIGVTITCCSGLNQFVTFRIFPECQFDIISQYLGVMRHLLSANVLVFFLGGVDTIANLLAILAICQRGNQLTRPVNPLVFVVTKNVGDISISDMRTSLSHLGVDQTLFNCYITGAHSADEVIGVISKTISETLTPPICAPV